MCHAEGEARSGTSFKELVVFSQGLSNFPDNCFFRVGETAKTKPVSLVSLLLSVFPKYISNLIYDQCYYRSETNPALTNVVYLSKTFQVIWLMR